MSTTNLYFFKKSEKLLIAKVNSAVNSILVAQADIVAATGADADAVSNAFAAVMRGNYTMIDNLRLGIKGSTYCSCHLATSTSCYTLHFYIIN